MSWQDFYPDGVLETGTEVEIVAAQELN